MATVTAGNLVVAPLTSRLSSSTSTRGLFKSPYLIMNSSFYRNITAKIRASSSTATVETSPGTNLNETEENGKKNLLACPICYDKLIWNGDPVFSVDSTPRSILKCSKCKKAYNGNDTHLDLTVISGSKKYGESRPASSELFRLPLISFMYERGWRQGFSVWGGFPGPEKEFELMKDYFKPVIGGRIIDASCGSGMFSRIFAKSGLFSLVVALDFSETMLKQCYEYIKQDENISQENLILVRADIARLPFASSSVDVVHAGAALHCWPSPSAGVAEISRILRPGGVFVATTYIIDGVYSFIPFLSPLRQGMELNENESNGKKDVLACPICYDKLIWNDDPVFSVDSTPRSILKCRTCKKAYRGNDTHLDLTVISGSKKYGESRLASSEIFRYFPNTS